jgi:hypothetical protein
MTDTDVSQGRESGSGEHKRPGFFGRLALFVRQVIVFVVLMAAVIAGFDYVFTNVVLFVFG